MTIDPELLERLRRSGIRIDREGRFIHEGQEVTHLGLRQALWRWLDRLEAEEPGTLEGSPRPPATDSDEQARPPPRVRYVLRLDEKRYAYVDVDDTPLVARAVRMAGDRALLALSDGSEEALDPGTLTVDEAGVLRCWVRGGRLEARLSNSAAAALADRIVEDDAARIPPRRRKAGREL